MPAVKIKAGLEDSELETFNKLCHFAYSPTMQHVGPEYSYLPALKWTQTGHRIVYMASMHSLT
eukprot:5198520-Prorocentrum_lima.AAC.1